MTGLMSRQMARVKKRDMGIWHDACNVNWMSDPLRHPSKAAPIDLAYLAGLIDGEGTIGLERRHKSDRFRSPVLSIASTDRELLNLPLAIFGGHVSRKLRKVQEHHLDAYTYRVSYRGAIDALVALQPYLRCPEKVRRARWLVEAHTILTPRNGKYTSQQLAAKEQFEKDFFDTRRHFA